jgi:hypothetical protein
MKKLLDFLASLFIEISLFNLTYKPYNGGRSFLFRVDLLGLHLHRGDSVQIRHLFCFEAEKFYQWRDYRYTLDIFFIHIIIPHYAKI